MEKLTKKQQIKELKEGDFVRDIFVVKIKRSIRPYARGYSFSLILSDSSGVSIEYKYWGGQDEEKIKTLFSEIKGDSIIFASGKVDSYNGKLGINADENSELKILNFDEYEADFIASSNKNIDEMYSLLISKIDSLDNLLIQQLLKNILLDVGEKLKKHPGAIQIHHNWRGGLLEHVLEMIEYCETSCKVFPNLNRDLLITGAILHDIGKLEELETTSRIKGTQKGQLVGHLSLGLNYVSKKLNEVGLDELTKNKILHLLVSHHGKMDLGSPKEPMFPEALALHYTDELSSKISTMNSFIENSKDVTEDEFMYYPREGRNIFLK
jgi:3'-5' exoribonuclease